MTDNTDLIADLRTIADNADDDDGWGWADRIREAADALAARDAEVERLRADRMTDHSELIARLRKWADQIDGDGFTNLTRPLREAADALAARDAACGHLDNQLVAKVLRIAQHSERTDFPELFSDEWDALRAATFEVTD